MIINKLNWISSIKATPDQLDQLDKRMADFYSTLAQRQDYQQLNDDRHEAVAHPNNKLADQLADHIIANGYRNVLEVGCGTGKIYARLKTKGFHGAYTGIEMAEYVIRGNQAAYPEATWKTGSVYNIRENCSYDCCFAFFVLEHLIYPHKGLEIMLNTVKPGGSLILVFPDVRSSGIVASQKIGRHYGMGAKEQLRKGKVIDAVVSLWEGKIMRQKLKKLNELYGDFVINYTPYCLDKECNQMEPDFDAVYLGSKEEVEKWATAKGCVVSYPSGTDGFLFRNAYMSIMK